MCGRFLAMASDCELLVDSSDEKLARQLSQIVAAEAWRIEQKFSRYRDDSIIHKIHGAQGRAVAVDEETTALLNFAEQCYQLSDGLFDITSGILRKAWLFDGSDNIPSRQRVKDLLPFVGWQKLDWNAPHLTLPEGMQIDFGGFGKEYAVDRAATLVAEYLAAQNNGVAFLINFGGDLFASGAPKNADSWAVGIESIGGSTHSVVVQLKYGGLATSGDARRFLQRNGKRYSHVLNPRTGWPVSQAAAAITVAAPNCVDAGFLATLAMLNGGHAQEFLEAQSVLFWIQQRYQSPT